MIDPSFMELVSHAATLSWKIADAYQNVPRQRGRCRAVVEQITYLGRLLKEIKPALPNPLTPQAKAYFEILNEALEKAYRLMEKTSKASTIKYILTSKQVAEDLISVSSDIEACLRGLPLIQLAQTTGIHDQVKNLQSSFGELGKQLEEHSVLTREQQDLATEVLAILRCKNSTEQNSTRLISWLAEQFDSDTQTVANEFQDLKKNLNEQAEVSAESKKMVEAELLEQIVLCIDELETHKAMDTIDHTGIPREFQCGICLGVMERPVILSSGHSFCKVCIEESFQKGPATCPCSRMPVRPDLLIENVALRGAISRWWKQTTSSVKEVAVKTEPVLQRSYSDKAVQEMVKELGSQHHIRLLRNLNFLLEVSSSVDGPALIYKLGGVEPLANLLESGNKKITEKVTSILAQLTKASMISGEDPEGVQLLNDIFESCLDKLISLMSRGTGMTRLRAAETLANLLLIPEVIECLLFQPGIVASLASLSSESGDALEVSLRGLAMLSRNNDHNLTGSDSLVASLVDFLHSEEDHIVEEAVVGLRSGMTPQACTVLRKKNALPSLVRCAIADGVMQEAAVMILETFVKHEGFSELVDAGFTKHISGLLSSSGLSANKVLFAGVLRLSKGCLEAQQDLSLELVGLQSSVPRLMSVLPVREYTAEALALLKTICVKDSTCKELVLDTGGLQVFQELASSSLSTCRKGALALIRILLRSSSCQETFTRAGGINTLGNVTLIDESIECITEAVVCLSLLTSNPKLRSSALESLELDKIISFMDERFPGECREAAGSIAILLLDEESSPPLSKQSLKLLMNVVQQGENVAVKRRAGKLLLMYATTKGLEGATRTVSLKVFIELVEGAGEAYKNLLLKFISGFSQSQSIFESGGIPLLLNAFSTKEYQRAAAGSIRTLVNSIPSSHEALLEAGFGETGVEFLSSESDDSKSSCIADISASLVSIYLKRKQDPLFMDLITALVKLMKNSSLDVISSAACSVFQLLPLDIEGMLLLKKSDLMKPLLQLLQSGPKLEALELLGIAVEDANARGEICREGGIPKLIQCLDLQNHRAQELASSILLTLGKPNDSIPDYRLDEIRRNMISSGIITNLLKILGEPRHTAVMNSACLIRNLGYSGQNAAAEEVFTVLFNLLRFYMNNTSTEGYTERLKYVFLALQPFFGDRRLKMLVRGSLGVVLQALSVGFGGNDEDIKHCALNLLLELLEEVNLSREVASTLVTNWVSHLRNIMQNVENINCKKLSCLLMKQMIKLVSNPQQACKVMRERDCIKVLFYLKQFPGCSKEANEVLELMKKNERASKICIADAENSFFPWGRTNSATF